MLHGTPRSSPEAWGLICEYGFMRMLLDIVRQSLSTLWAHKMRSFLTMFGIAWGVGSLLLLGKLMAGVYPPTSGTRKVVGRISSLFDIALEEKVMPESDLKRVLDPLPMTKGGVQ